MNLEQVPQRIVKTYHNAQAKNAWFRVDLVQHDHTVEQFKLGHALAVGHNVAQIASMTLRVSRGSMTVATWIEVTAHALASIAHVAESVDVEAMLAWTKASNLARYLDASVWLFRIESGLFPIPEYEYDLLDKQTKLVHQHHSAP